MFIASARELKVLSYFIDNTNFPKLQASVVVE